MKTATAKLRYLKMTPRKVRRLADIVKGLSASEAEAQLMMQGRRAAHPLLKLLRSALANAKEMKLDAAKLVVKSIRVDQGPMLKRFLPRARGSASPIERKMSHVALILEEGEQGAAVRYHIAPLKKEKKEHAHAAKKKSAAPERAEKEAAPKKEGSSWTKKFFRRKSI